MAKSKVSADAPAPATAAKSRGYDEWEVRDAMRTLMRAEEIEEDAKLMKLVKKAAAEEAEKMEEVSERADRLARRGLVSDKQLAKLKKTKPLAKGNEGDSKSTPAGISKKS